MYLDNIHMDVRGAEGSLNYYWKSNKGCYLMYNMSPGTLGTYAIPLQLGTQLGAIHMKIVLT